MDQTPQLAEMPDVPGPGALDDAPPLGPFRTFQAPIRDIAELTGLDLGQLVAADRIADRSDSRSNHGRIDRRELAVMEDLDLDFALAD